MYMTYILTDKDIERFFNIYFCHRKAQEEDIPLLVTCSTVEKYTKYIHEIFYHLSNQIIIKLAVTPPINNIFKFNIVNQLTSWQNKLSDEDFVMLNDTVDTTYRRSLIINSILTCNDNYVKLAKKLCHDEYIDVLEMLKGDWSWQQERYLNRLLQAEK